MNKSILFIIGGIAIVLLGVFLWSGYSANTSNLPTQTTKLAEIPESYYQALSLSGGVNKNIKGLAFSPDGSRVALVVQDTGKEAVYLNGVAGTLYDSVELPGFPFSPNGKHYLYIAHQNEDYFVVVDGKEQEHYKDSIDTSDIYLNPSGVPGYVITIYGKNLGDSLTQEVVFNGHVGHTYRAVEYLRMSPDGQSVVYYGCNPDNYVKFQSDLNQGTGFCTFVSQDLTGNVHENGGIFYSGGIIEAIENGSIAYSPNGNLLAYTTRLGNGSSIVINGISTMPPGNYDTMNIRQVIFSRDSKHNAYVLQACDSNTPCPLNNLSEAKGGFYYVVLDNSIASKQYDEITSLTFDGNGQLAYFARTSNQWSLIDGNNTYTVPANFSKFPSQISFSPDNSYIYSYTNTNGKTDVIFKGQQIIESDYVLPYFGFTQDGKVIYTSISSDSKSMSLNIGGIDHKHDFVQPMLSLPSSIYGPFYTLTPNGKIVYGALDGKDISVIVEPAN